MIRDIVSIDEDLCDGCGQCIPSCAEGAIQVIDGKARLISDALCDGLGSCLGHCPQGAITIDRRAAAPYDGEQLPRHPQAGDAWSSTGSNRGGAGVSSALTHWPVQLRLLPPAASAIRGARLLITSDCVPVAYADFHADLLGGRAVVMACPKLDDTRGYVVKLTEMIRQNDLVDIIVARMEVPCCSGIVHMVVQAHQLAGSNVPVSEVLISIRGQVLARRQIPTEPVVSQ